MSEYLPYKDSSLSIDERVKDLLSRMTIEEKIGQMLQLNGKIDPEESYRKYHPGSFLHLLDNQTVTIQKMALESRLGIPLLFGIDAIHGHSFYKGATVFPTQLALSCSWDPILAKSMAQITAREMSDTGLHLTFSPVLCVTRDLRWGRVNETFGEDTFLIGDFACAMIEGYQGNNFKEKDSVLACAKHFAGYSESHGGRDATESDISQRKLQSFFLPPFERAAKSGCASIMTAYVALDGVPCTTNKWLLTEVLKEKWGSKAFVVTDWENVINLVKLQKVCSDITEASAASVIAGNDMIMATPEFYDGALNAFRKGIIKESHINNSCGRILAWKFKIGLFENPRLPGADKSRIGCKAHMKTALQAARESIVLLRNNGILPLDKSKQLTIAVVGPNADSTINQLGDWSLGSGQTNNTAGEHPREMIITVLDGIRMIVSKGNQISKVLYSKGCTTENQDESGLIDAMKIAEKADVIVAVVGDSLSHNGEWDKATARLEIPGAQQKLLDTLKKTGKPLVIVLINGKPLCIPWIAHNADAMIEAFNPGMMGGQAIAEVIFGDVNPCGKLTTSFAKHVGQQPVWYNQFPGQHGKTYCDTDQMPLFSFGEGISYSEFEYSNLIIHTPVLKSGENLHVSIDVLNRSSRNGKEIAQLYIDDLVTSRTWPHKMLKGYKKIDIPAGKKITIDFYVDYNSLAIFTLDDLWITEAGEFEVMIGKSSRDEDMLKEKFIVFH